MVHVIYNAENEFTLNENKYLTEKIVDLIKSDNKNYRETMILERL